jgi:hypothetical protein
MALLKNQPFSSHSGLHLPFKIDCDALSREDIKTITGIIARKFTFREVYGVPRGGIRLAKALRSFCLPTGQHTLIVDDVFTTGASMEEARKKIGINSIGVVIFARRPCPAWIRPVFQLSEWVEN